MTSPSSPEGSGLIERLTQAKTWQREDLTALCFEAASALSAYEGRLEEARKALEDAARWFEDYERQHRAKGTAEGDEKAVTNAARARVCRGALEQSGEGLGASVASRAGEGLRPFASESQHILGKEE